VPYAFEDIQNKRNIDAIKNINLKPKKMNRLTKILTVIFVITFFSSCASIVSKSKWPLAVNTDPNGAKVEVTDKNGIVVYNGNTPAVLSLKSGAGYFAKQSYKIKLTMDGYGDRIIPVECSLNGWYWGNLLIGGIIGMLIVDPATGAMYKLDREVINETLNKSLSTLGPSLRIINIQDIPDSLKEHLVCLK
jgi:hypothetical protein